MIDNRKNEFLVAYQEYIKIINAIFGLNLPEPMEIDNKVGLLIFDFDEDQKEGRLKQVITKLKVDGIPCYTIGKKSEINAETLW